MKMSGCVFCKIANGEIPCHKVYEDGKFLAFLDANPANPGHLLIIPKNHYTTILDMDDKKLQEIILIIKKLGRSVMNAVSAGGFNVFVNNFEVAGQIVPHVHFHIVPRFPKDGHEAWAGKKLPETEMKKIAKKIANSL